MKPRVALAFGFVLAALIAPTGAIGAEPPTISESWVTDVTSTSADLRATIDPDGQRTTYRFEYLSEVAYDANLTATPPRQAFAGAAWAPPSGAALLGAGTTPLPVVQHLGSLAPLTAYRYRVVATSAGGTVGSVAHFFATEAATNVVVPADERAFEMVSPVDKEGGSIAVPGSLFGGGEFEAAAVGVGAVTYSAATAFGAATGAPPGSQYISLRGANGWSTVNISAPLESGGYGDEPDGAPYKAFSEDLGRGLMLDPRDCPPGTGCPRGYSRRESATGAFSPLPAQAAGMRVLEASPDLGHVVFEGEGQTYEWNGGGLVPVERLPAGAGAEASFQAVSTGGRFTFYLEGGHLYRHDSADGATADLTPAGGVIGVLGIDADGTTVYFQDAAGLVRWRGGTMETIAAGGEATLPTDYPPATGTARVSADGLHLAFLSRAALAGFDNSDAATGEPDAELYLYGPSPGGGPVGLHCASCNPTGERPAGSASIPGALTNGSTRVYKPRVLSTSGDRVFFDTSDRLALNDTDSRPDVYEWEAAGEGNCTRLPGCQSLVSGGRETGGAFLDASAVGDDVYFLTEESLVPADPGSIDVYDARVGGGLPEPGAPFICKGDACQPLPSAPEDPSPGTLVPTSGNPPLKVERAGGRRHGCRKGKARRHGRCVPRHRHHRRHRRRHRHGHDHGGRNHR